MSNEAGFGVGFGLLAITMIASASSADAFDGAYGGVQFGAGGPNASGYFGSTNQDLSGVVQNGLMGGGQIGWNFSSGSWVYGIEGDVSIVDWGQTQLTDEDGDPKHSFDADLFATVRARLGRVYGGTLVYGTAGLAILDGEFSSVNGASSKGVTSLGGVVGGGIETAVSHNMTFKAEGLWAIFDHSTDLNGLSASNSDDSLKIKDAFVARLGLNWHLGTNEGDYQITPVADLDPVPLNRWSGLYMGGHFGYGGVDTAGRWDTAGSNYDLGGISDNGILGGVQIGMNMQSGAWVFGVEGDFAFTNWDGSVGPDGEGDIHQLDVDLFATIRGRAGVVVSDTLLYATAGAAILDADLTVEIGSTPDVGRSLTAVGGVVGGGVETFLSDNISAKAEALYVIFDESTDISDLVDGDAGDFLKVSDGFVFRTGLNWHFN